MSPIFLLSLALSLSSASIPPPLSKEELRFLFASEQGGASSCGLAAIAAFLTAFHGLAATEADLALELEGEGGGRISLRELLILLERRGFVAVARRLDLGALGGALLAASPLLLHIQRPKPHFLLLIGMEGGFALVADPSEGLVFIPEEEVSARWSGAIVAALPAQGPERAGLLARRAWAIAASLDLAWGRLAALERAAGSASLSFP